jgi:hypothetical protein
MMQVSGNREQTISKMVPGLLLLVLAGTSCNLSSRHLMPMVWDPIMIITTCPGSY